MRRAGWNGSLEETGQVLRRGGGGETVFASRGGAGGGGAARCAPIADVELDGITVG